MHKSGSSEMNAKLWLWRKALPVWFDNDELKTYVQLYSLVTVILDVTHVADQAQDKEN